LNWSQFATSSSRHRGAAYRPWAFTEHGALMAANILRSGHAAQMSIYVIRAFVRLREHAPPGVRSPKTSGPLFRPSTRYLVKAWAKHP
jgi:hypothetical protein